MKTITLVNKDKFGRIECLGSYATSIEIVVVVSLFNNVAAQELLEMLCESGAARRI